MLRPDARGEGRRASGRSGIPKEIGGGGLPFLDYVYVNEVVGRSEHAMVALGTHSLQDSIMLNLYASPEWRERYLAPLVAGEIFPSFAMTEPEVASSDPTQLQTSRRARRRPLGDQRPQVVHHRRRPRRLHHRHGAHRARRAAARRRSA